MCVSTLKWLVFALICETLDKCEVCVDYIFCEHKLQKNLYLVRQPTLECIGTLGNLFALKRKGTDTYSLHLRKVAPCYQSKKSLHFDTL